jgi:hypothetical protein
MNGKDYNKQWELYKYVKKKDKLSKVKIKKKKNLWNILQVAFWSYLLIGNPPFLFIKQLNKWWNRWVKHVLRQK